MGKRLRTWYKQVWEKLFGVGDWQGASEDWRPKLHTAMARPSDAFDELDMLEAFDRIIADLKAEPDWLTAFKAKTARMQWDHKYSQLLEDTGSYTMAQVKALNYKLAIA